MPHSPVLPLPDRGLGRLSGARSPLPSGDVRGAFVRIFWALFRVAAVWCLVFGLVGLVLFAARAAFANANTIPQKQETLRAALGYAPGEAFVYDAKTWGSGWLEFTVDEAVGLPDQATLVPGAAPARASSVRLELRALLDEHDGIIRSFSRDAAPTLAQVYSWAFPLVGGTGWASLFARAPCVSPDQANRALVGAWDGNYDCLEELQLVSMPSRVADMALWAKPDWPMIRRLQALHGSRGVPVVINANWTRARVEDETASALPSVLRMEVLYVFVLPKSPTWVPPSDAAIP